MLKAILFDFDGVLFDTEPLHFSVFRKVLAEEGLTLTQHDYYGKYVGYDDKGCFEAILTEHGRPTPQGTIQRLVERKAALFREHLNSDLVVFPGAVELVSMAATHYRLAIVSGALRHEIEHCLEITGIRKAFEHITAAQDVRRGKPDPEGYLHALRRLNERVPLAASEVLVIEDTVAGIEAAHAAGMRCLAVTHTFEAHQLSAAEAVTPSLQECDLAALERRFWS